MTQPLFQNYTKEISSKANVTIKNFLGKKEIDSTKPIACIIETDIRIRDNVEMCKQVRLAQNNVYSDTLFEANYFNLYSEDGWDVDRIVLSILHDLTENHLPPEQISIYITVPENNDNKLHDVTSEIKKSIEWLHVTHATMEAIQYKKREVGSVKIWRKLQILLRNKGVDVDVAFNIVKEHTKNILQPYMKQSESISSSHQEEYSSMERALILYLCLAKPNAIKHMSNEDMDFFVNFSLNESNANTYRSKLELFSKYLSEEVLMLVFGGTFNNHHSSDIFNITPFLDCCSEIMTRWVQRNPLRSDQVAFIKKTVAKDGFSSPEHFKNTLKFFATSMHNSNPNVAREIEELVFSELLSNEDFFLWSQISNHELPKIALHIIRSRSTKSAERVAFAKGVISQYGASNCMSIIECPDDVAVILEIFNMKPDDALKICPDEKKKEVMQFIISSFST